MARILVVDDAAYMRLMLSNILKRIRHDVIEAVDGKGAIERYQISRPDLVTMDILMPREDGLCTLESLIKLDETAKIIIISVMRHEGQIIQALEVGAKDFIMKPFNEHVILLAVDRVLGGYTRNEFPS